MNAPRSPASAWRHFLRAMKLRCPSCGRTPIFVTWHRVRSLADWLTPLDGCPRCGYPFEREPGYYLLAIWAVNYGFGGVLGLLLYGVLEWQFDLPVWQLIAAVLAPVLLFCILFARHAKALFLAVDLFFDPHDRQGGDDGGNRPVPPCAPQGSAPSGKPCEPAGEVR